MHILVLGCLLIDNPANRKRMNDYLGGADVPFPPPYKHSIPGNCQNCNCDIWLGPKIQETSAQDPSLPVLCLLCVVVVHGPNIGTVVGLTNKKAGQ